MRKQHITLLTRLFDAYGLTLPANTAAERTVLPGSLVEAYTTGIAAENANIAMYAQFLAQADLPQDIADTFSALQNASVSHLAAFTQNAEETGAGARHAQMGNETAAMPTQRPKAVATNPRIAPWAMRALPPGSGRSGIPVPARPIQTTDEMARRQIGTKQVERMARPVLSSNHQNYPP